MIWTVQKAIFVLTQAVLSKVSSALIISTVTRVLLVTFALKRTFADATTPLIASLVGSASTRLVLHLRTFAGRTLIAKKTLNALETLVKELLEHVE